MRSIKKYMDLRLGPAQVRAYDPPTMAQLVLELDKLSNAQDEYTQDDSTTPVARRRPVRAVSPLSESEILLKFLERAFMAPCGDILTSLVRHGGTAAYKDLCPDLSKRAVGAMIACLTRILWEYGLTYRPVSIQVSSEWSDNRAVLHPKLLQLLTPAVVAATEANHNPESVTTAV